MYFMEANHNVSRITSKNSITYLADTYSVLDTNEKIVLLHLLTNYIAISHKDACILNDGNYYYQIEDIVSVYDPDHRQSLLAVLNAYDATIHNFGTEYYLDCFRHVYNDGCVVDILKHEGFM